MSLELHTLRTLPRRRAWIAAPAPRRLVAAVAAVLLTLLVLAPFLLLRQPVTPQAERITVLLLPTEPPPIAEAAATLPKRSATGAEPSSPPQAQRPRLAVTPVPEAGEPATAIAPGVATAAVPEPPLPATSSALNLSRQALRQAAQDSASPTRRLAARSGTYLGDDRPSSDEQLSRSVSGATKPDCLASGGSLLSLFSIAYQMARDKCK